MENKKVIRKDFRRLNTLQTNYLSYMKSLSDEGRDHPVVWNIMHMYSSAQLAKVLANKRGIDEELAAITAAIHDIGAVMTKTQKNHAEAGELYVYEFLEKYNETFRGDLPIITKKEMDSIAYAVVRHSQKDVVDEDHLTELLKDVDSLDRYLHGVKTKDAHYDRCVRVAKEIGMEINI